MNRVFGVIGAVLLGYYADTAGRIHGFVATRRVP